MHCSPLPDGNVLSGEVSILCSNELLTLSGNVISGVWVASVAGRLRPRRQKKLPASSPGRFSVALEMGRRIPKAREKRPGDAVGFFVVEGGGGRGEGGGGRAIKHFCGKNGALRWSILVGK